MSELSKLATLLAYEGTYGQSLEKKLIGIIDERDNLRDRVKELEIALKNIESIKWGYDGDCGAQAIINTVIDA